MHIGLHVKYPLFLSFHKTWIFSRDFRKIPKYPISRKSIQWEPSLSHANRRTETTKLIVAFRNFVKAYKNEYAFLIPVPRVTCHVYITILHFITNNIRWSGLLYRLYLLLKQLTNEGQNTNIPLHKTLNFNPKISMKFREFLLVILNEDWYKTVREDLM
jgi:hypothetical protein